MNAPSDKLLDRTPASIGRVMNAAVAVMKDVANASPALEAGLLLGHVIGKPRAYLLAWPERAVPLSALKAFRELLGRRTAGEPLAYILGRREFWSLELKVTVDTLIPRPETERLVELALERMPPGRICRVADLGTGCGAIAAALASERPDARLIATDVSDAALKVAERNFHDLGLDAVETRQGSWFDVLEKDSPFDIICSNPPYVAANDPHLRIGDLRYEPPGALVAGDEGLDAIADIARDCPGFLTMGGWLLLEHGENQGEPVRSLLSSAGLSGVATFRDLAGRDRVSVGRKP